MAGRDEYVKDATFVFAATVNGQPVSIRTPYSSTLAEVVRGALWLTGTKISCDEEICGACTVLVDGRPVSSCTFLAHDARSSQVVTIEGLAGEDGELHPVQRAFLDNFGFQCGFCTPGMILSAVALLTDQPDATRGQVVHHMDGNICRCTGYESIVTAVEQAQAEMRDERV